MPGARERNEYYWIRDRVVRRRRERPSGHGPWSRSPDQKFLVASIEQDPDGMRVIEGPANRPERLADAVMMEHGKVPSDVVPGIDVRIPERLLDELSDKIRTALDAITRKFPRMGSEDRTTGALFDRLEGNTFADGWEVQITAHHYSNVSKENVIGADAGVVIDIKSSEGGRVYKSLLVQGKRNPFVPRNALDLPRVSEQLNLMKKYSNEGQVWVYTPDGVRAYGPEDMTKPLDPAVVLVDAVRCGRGDRRPWAISNALDAKHVLEVLVGD